jgi:predicted HicB family RNase H-like nuclease
MALTEAQKRANNKYIAEHMTVLGCKVRKEYADKVREKAKAEGTSVNAILKKALDEFLEK